MRSVKKRLFASLLAFVTVFTTISWDGVAVYADPANDIEVTQEATSGNAIVVDATDDVPSVDDLDISADAEDEEEEDIVIEGSLFSGVLLTADEYQDYVSDEVRHKDEWYRDGNVVSGNSISEVLDNLEEFAGEDVGKLYARVTLQQPMNEADSISPGSEWGGIVFDANGESEQLFVGEDDTLAQEGVLSVGRHFVYTVEYEEEMEDLDEEDNPFSYTEWREDRYVTVEAYDEGDMAPGDATYYACTWEWDEKGYIGSVDTSCEYTRDDIHAIADDKNATWTGNRINNYHYQLGKCHVSGGVDLYINAEVDPADAIWEIQYSGDAGTVTIEEFHHNDATLFCNAKLVINRWSEFASIVAADIYPRGGINLRVNNGFDLLDGFHAPTEGEVQVFIREFNDENPVNLGNVYVEEGIEPGIVSIKYENIYDLNRDTQYVVFGEKPADTVYAHNFRIWDEEHGLWQELDENGYAMIREDGPGPVDQPFLYEGVLIDAVSYAEFVKNPDEYGDFEWTEENMAAADSLTELLQLLEEKSPEASHLIAKIDSCRGGDEAPEKVEISDKWDALVFGARGEEEILWIDEESKEAEVFGDATGRHLVFSVFYEKDGERKEDKYVSVEAFNYDENYDAPKVTDDTEWYRATSYDWDENGFNGSFDTKKKYATKELRKTAEDELNADFYDVQWFTYQYKVSELSFAGDTTVYVQCGFDSIENEETHAQTIKLSGETNSELIVKECEWGNYVIEGSGTEDVVFYSGANVGGLYNVDVRLEQVRQGEDGVKWFWMNLMESPKLTSFDVEDGSIVDMHIWQYDLKDVPNLGELKNQNFSIRLNCDNFDNKPDIEEGTHMMDFIVPDGQDYTCHITYFDEEYEFDEEGNPVGGDWVIDENGNAAKANINIVAVDTKEKFDKMLEDDWEYIDNNGGARYYSGMDIQSMLNQLASEDHFVRIEVLNDNLKSQVYYVPEQVHGIVTGGGILEDGVWHDCVFPANGFVSAPDSDTTLVLRNPLACESGQFDLSGCEEVVFDCPDADYGKLEFSGTYAIINQHAEFGSLQFHQIILNSDLRVNNSLDADEVVLRNANYIAADKNAALSIGTVTIEEQCAQEITGYLEKVNADGSEEWATYPIYYFKNNVVKPDDYYRVYKTDEEGNDFDIPFVEARRFIKKGTKIVEVDIWGKKVTGTTLPTADQIETHENKLYIDYMDGDESVFFSTDDIGTKFIELREEGAADKIALTNRDNAAMYVDADGNVAIKKFMVSNLWNATIASGLANGDYDHHESDDVDQMLKADKVGRYMTDTAICGDDLGAVLKEADAAGIKYYNLVFCDLNEEMASSGELQIPATAKDVYVTGMGYPVPEIEVETLPGESALGEEESEQEWQSAKVVLDGVEIAGKTTNVTFLFGEFLASSEDSVLPIVYNTKSATGKIVFNNAFLNDSKPAVVTVGAKDATSTEKVGDVKFIGFNVLAGINAKSISMDSACLAFMQDKEVHKAVDFGTLKLSETDDHMNEIVYVGQYSSALVPTIGAIDATAIKRTTGPVLGLKYVTDWDSDYRGKSASIPVGAPLVKLPSDSSKAYAILKKMDIRVPENCYVTEQGILGRWFPWEDVILQLDYKLGAADTSASDSIALRELYLLGDNYEDADNYILAKDQVFDEKDAIHATNFAVESEWFKLTFDIPASEFKSEYHLYYYNEQENQYCYLGDASAYKSIGVTVKSIGTIADIEIPNGTSLDDIWNYIPETVSIKTESAAVNEREIECDLNDMMDNYDPDKKTAQTFSVSWRCCEEGEITLLGLDELTCEDFTVTVLGEQVPTPVASNKSGAYKYSEENPLVVSFEADGADDILYSFDGENFLSAETEDDLFFVTVTDDVELYVKAVASDRPDSEIATYNYKVAYDLFNMNVEMIPDQTYTGKEIKPTVQVYDGDVLLVYNKDYTVSYVNNISAADYLYIEGKLTATSPKAIVKGKGNYSSTIEVPFNIKPIETGDDLLVNYKTAITVNSKGVADLTTALQSVYYGKLKLVKGTDYTLTYKQDEALVVDEKKVPAGNYDIVISTQGNFVEDYYLVHVEVSDRKSLSTAAVNLEKTAITVFDMKYFDWDSETFIIPVKSVKLGTKTIPEKYYTVEYIDNDNIGIATVTVSAKSDDELGEENPYVGSVTTTFKLKPASLSEFDFKWNQKEFVYSGKEIQPTEEDYELSYEGTKLYHGSYTVDCVNNTNAGTATMILTGIEDYGVTGTLKKSFTIKAPEISKNIGTKKSPKMILSDDFRITVFDEVSLAETVIENNEDLMSGEMLYFKQNKAGVTPSVKVEYLSDGEYMTLEQGKDYSVSYENNKAASTDGKYGIITIKGKGNFKGTIAGKKDLIDGLTFTVLKKDLKSDDIEIEIPSQPYKKGSTIVYKPAPVIYDGEKKLKEGTDYKVTYDNNNNAGITIDPETGLPDDVKYATATITGIGSYEGTSTQEFAIIPMAFDKLYISIKDQTYSPDGVWPSDEDITIKTSKNGKVLDFVDSDEYTYYIDEAINCDKAGTAKVVLVGTGIFEGTQTVKFTIKPVDINGLEWKVSEPFSPVNYASYSETKELPLALPMDKGGVKLDSYIPNGWDTLEEGIDYSVTYKDNKAVTTGTKRASVTLKGKGNYTGSITVKYQIKQAEIVLGDEFELNVPNIAYDPDATKYTTSTVLTQNGVKLKEGTDYKVTYINNAKRKASNLPLDPFDNPDSFEVGVKITGIGNYTTNEPIESSFFVVPANLKNVTFKIKDQTYDRGNAVGIDYSDIESVSYKIGTKKYTLSADKYDFSDLFTIDSESYKKNTKVGTASVTIKAIDSDACPTFIGSKTASFKIVPYGMGSDEHQ